jgi:protein-S-isoprenylcysteine O-methyltransferase Ste14
MIAAAILPKHETLAQKWRKPISKLIALLGLAAAVLTVPANLGSGWHEVMELSGFLLLMLAAVGRIWSLAYVAGRKNRELCQTGPYSLMRNPLYFFSFVGLVGFTLGMQNILLGVVGAACFLIYYSFVIRGEECRLRQLHGETFEAYCHRVPRFWPRSARPTSEVSLELNLVPFMRGLREVFWFLAATVLADSLEWAHVMQLWPTFTLPF